MSEMKVRRKGYRRGPYSYVRNGKQINVKKHWIPETTYITEDRGKPRKYTRVGRRPRSRLHVAVSFSKQLMKKCQYMIDIFE
jgi:hypothetical protein